MIKYNLGMFVINKNNPDSNSNFTELCINGCLIILNRIILGGI